MGLFGLAMLGCERHSHDETKILHGDHGSHAADGEHHGDDHGEKHEGHGEKSEAHGEAKPHAEHGEGKAHEEKPKKDEPRDVGL